MSENREVVLSVKGLTKRYKKGFCAVSDVSFDVHRGEFFGLLGPNGAGKTTTIKSLLRLIFPSEGTVTIFGHPAEKRETMQRVGYMPENPYLYRYLKAHEFLDLCGRLCGMPSARRRDAVEAMIDRVGLRHAVDRPIGKFSKGMMQRVGLAQAMLHDPELIVLDEPMSGLDPVGRKEIRDLLLELKQQGKTLLFTSHILSDVETLCDRVVILQKGKVRAEGTVAELAVSQNDDVEIEVSGLAPDATVEGGTLTRVAGDRTLIRVGGQTVNDTLSWVLAKKATVISVHPHRRGLEHFFVENETPKNTTAT